MAVASAFQMSVGCTRWLYITSAVRLECRICIREMAGALGFEPWALGFGVVSQRLLASGRSRY